MRDPIALGLASGWRVQDASQLEGDLSWEADVAIVGTGAGGGICAEILTLAGLSVVLLEEGPLRSSRDFHMREAEAYPQLYQESAARKTKDKAINILQGRCVGGSTTVNWASCFRTPATTLAYWRDRFGLEGLTETELTPWFDRVEARLGIRQWSMPPNANNGVLASGGRALGIPVDVIRRNVKGCWDLGYCGMGCPTNAKQSMLVTTIPTALAGGARLLTRVRVERLMTQGDAVTGVYAHGLDESGLRPNGRRVEVRTRHVVLAAGAIGSPAVLLRSGAPDPGGLLGRRTCLHPVVISAATMPSAIEGYNGAPQSIYSDHFLHQGPVDGPIGFKLEVPPMHPVILSTTLQGYGQAHATLMADFPRVHAMLALLRDGFHEKCAGGRVVLRGDGTPVLDYPLNDFVWDGARRAFLAMAETQFAAGAERVMAVHEDCTGWASWREAREGIGALNLAPHRTRVVSAHVMGGCGMGRDARAGVVSDDGRHHQWSGLSVLDGSVFPTSIGANPQLSIYALTARNATRLAGQLTGRAPPDWPASPAIASHPAG